MKKPIAREIGLRPQYFMKHSVKRINKEISAYLRDKQIECCTFNSIQHHNTTENNDSDKDVLLH